MAAEIVEVLIDGGKATAAPPLGPALGPLGVNIGQVVAQINQKTDSFKGMQVPVKVEVDKDSKEFSISIGTPPTSQLIKKEANLKKGSGHPGTEFVADLAFEQVIKIAKQKEDTILAATPKAGVCEVIGTCRSMGVKVEKLNGEQAIREVKLGKFDKQILSGKTELSAEELKDLELEKKAMQEELTKHQEEQEVKAKVLIESLKGKDNKFIRAKLHEAEIYDEVINKLVPEEKEDKK